MDKTLNKQKPNISIIVPVYNVEKYINRCLNSIFTQNFNGTFEVIAVDDASTDNSLKEIKKYQLKEPRLIIIEHKTNKNLSVARATGMSSSSGDYIMHVDSDDWLLPNALKKLYSKCIETNADVVVFNYVRENDKGQRTLHNNIQNDVCTTNKINVQKHFLGAPWNKIIKSSLKEDLISGQIGVNNGEDLIYSTEILLKANKICLISGYYYAYFVNTESLTNNVNSSQFLKTMKLVLNQLSKIITKFKPNHEFTNYLMNYYEKFIYMEIAKINFSKINSIKSINKSLIQDILTNPLISNESYKKLNTSLNYKYVSLIEIYKKFGLKKSIAIILRKYLS